MAAYRPVTAKVGVRAPHARQKIFAKMELLNRDWLRKVYDRDQKQSRSVLNQSFCDKEIFLGKYFCFLNNRTFKLQVKNKIYYGLFIRYTLSTSRGNNSIETYGVSPVLGWNNSEYYISFIDHTLEFIKIRCHYNDLLDIRYEEITNEKFSEVRALFSIPKDHICHVDDDDYND